MSRVAYQKVKNRFIKCYSSSYWGKFRRIKLVACRCGADDRETQDWTCSQTVRKHGRWKQQSRNFNGPFKRHWIWDNEECHSTDTDKVERLEFIFKEKPWSEDKTEDYKSKIHNLFELISVLFFSPRDFNTHQFTVRTGQWGSCWYGATRTISLAFVNLLFHPNLLIFPPGMRPFPWTHEQIDLDFDFELKTFLWAEYFWFFKPRLQIS